MGFGSPCFIMAMQVAITVTVLIFITHIFKAMGFEQLSFELCPEVQVFIVLWTFIKYLGFVIENLWFDSVYMVQFFVKLEITIMVFAIRTIIKKANPFTKLTRVVVVVVNTNQSEEHHMV